MLSRRILVTESLPLPIRGPADQEVRVHQAAASPASRTRCSTRSLTVQMVSNPSWYAVMALPYLMEFPHECTRADVQPAVRQRAGPAHRQLGPEDPPRLRPVEGHAGAGQPAGEEPGPEGGDAGRDAVGAAGAGREPGPAERRHPVRRQPAERRDRPRCCGSWPSMQLRRRRLAVVPRRPAATTTSRSTSPPASAGCGTWA